MTDYEKKRVATRHRLRVNIEITDLGSGLTLTGITSVLSVRGCGVEMPRSLSRGLRVSIKLTHNQSELVVIGRIAYCRPNVGMGIEFIAVEPKVEAVLREWVGETSPALQP